MIIIIFIFFILPCQICNKFILPSAVVTLSPRLLRTSGAHLKIVHAVGKRDHKARVVVDGLITEDDVHAVVEIPEIVLGRGQLAAVVLWVVPAPGRESRTAEISRGYGKCAREERVDAAASASDGKKGGRWRGGAPSHNKGSIQT